MIWVSAYGIAIPAAEFDVVYIDNGRLWFEVLFGFASRGNLLRVMGCGGHWSARWTETSNWELRMRAIVEREPGTGTHLELESKFCACLALGSCSRLSGFWVPVGESCWSRLISWKRTCLVGGGPGCFLPRNGERTAPLFQRISLPASSNIGHVLTALQQKMVRRASTWADGKSSQISLMLGTCQAKLSCITKLSRNCRAPSSCTSRVRNRLPVL